MGAGRPKNQIPRSERLGLRLTKFELEKISRVAKQKNLTITEAILKGIDLLERDKPKKFKNLSKKKVKTKFGEVDEDIVDFLS